MQGVSVISAGGYRVTVPGSDFNLLKSYWLLLNPIKPEFNLYRLSSHSVVDWGAMEHVCYRKLYSFSAKYVLCMCGVVRAVLL